MDLFIPTKINKDNIFANGIGKKEVKRIITGTLISLPIGLVIGLLLMSGIRAVLISIVITGSLFACVTYLIVLKTSINLSVYIFVGLLKAYLKGQKYYKYKKLKEWF